MGYEDMLEDILKHKMNTHLTRWIGFRAWRLFQVWDKLSFISYDYELIKLNKNTATMIFNKYAVYIHVKTEHGFQTLIFGFWKHLKKLQLEPIDYIYNGIPQFEWAKKVLSNFLLENMESTIDYGDKKFHAGEWESNHGIFPVFVYCDKSHWFSKVTIVLFDDKNEMREFLRFLK